VTSGERAGALERSLGTLHRLEDGLLALILGAMVLLAPLQIALRDFFDTGVPWIDPLLRVLVLWVGLLGALAASRDHRHITVDVFARNLAERPQAAARAVTGFFAAGVSALVAWNAFRFVAEEFGYGSEAFAGLPAWIFEAVVPASFGLIALRYLLAATRDARDLLRPPGAPRG
jgi:TRAP-type C4-dicarboxylate transport system permease small subunit